MDDLKKIIGERIRQRRKECGLKQYELAEKLDISNNHMSSIENGKKNMSQELLVKVCDEFHVTPDFIFLGALRSNNVPRDIYERLQTFEEDTLSLTLEIIEVISRWGNMNR